MRILQQITRAVVGSTLALSLVMPSFGDTSEASAGDSTGSKPPRIGVYDSRVVAYAWFWGEAGTKKREALIAAAKAAKNGADPGRLAEVDGAVRAFQDHGHLQVFSTEPIDDLLVDIGNKLPEIMSRAGVTRLVSKWDAVALRDIGPMETVDVTDALAGAFLSPNERQAKIIAQMKSHPPLDLERARELLRSGQL